MADIYGDQNPENLNDNIDGGNQAHNIYALDGDDVIMWTGIGSHIEAGSGDDQVRVFTINGPSTLVTTIDGGAGNDDISVADQNAIVYGDGSSGDNGDDYLYGSSTGAQVINDLAPLAEQSVVINAGVHQEFYGEGGNDHIDAGTGYYTYTQRYYDENGNMVYVTTEGFDYTRSAVINGGTGNDYLGADLRTDYIFDSNFGHDVIAAANPNRPDHLVGSTITFSFTRSADLSLQRMGDDLLIVSDQGTLRVTDYFNLFDPITNASVYTIAFDNGADELSFAAIEQAVLNGGDSDDLILIAPTTHDGGTITATGGAGNDFISIGDGDPAPTVSAVVDGGSGDDVYALFNSGSTTLGFGRNSGRDFVYDAHGASVQYASVTIDVDQSAGAVTAGDLSISYENGLFTLGIAGSDAALVIDAVTAAGILGNSLTWTVDLGAQTVSVKDLLLATPEIQSGALVIDLGGTVVTGNGSTTAGGAYDGTANTQNETVLAYMTGVESGSDNETFQGVITTATFNSGFGQDTIVGSAQQIAFEDDVADFAFSRTGSDLTIANTVTGDSLLIQDYFLLQTGSMRGLDTNLTFNGLRLSSADTIDKLAANNTASVIQLDLGETYISNTSDPADAGPQTFYADLGPTVINAGAGDNTIYYGTDTTIIHDTSLGGHDVLKATTTGGAGNTVRIKVDDVTDLSSLSMSFQNEDILISNTVTGSTLLIDESYMTAVVIYDGIHDELSFTDLGRVSDLASTLIPGYTDTHTYSTSYGNQLIESAGSNTNDVLHAYINVGLATWVELDGKGGDDTYIGAVSSEIFDYYTGSNTTILGLADNSPASGGYDIVDMASHANVSSTSLATDFSRAGNDLVFNDGTGSLTIKDFFLTQSLAASFEETMSNMVLGEFSTLNLDAAQLQALEMGTWMQLGAGIYNSNYSPASVSHVVDAIQFSDRTVGYAEIAALFPDGPGPNPDTIYGTEDPDERHGQGGNDTIYGYSKDNAAGDAANGANDGDELYGEEGDDTLYGGNGADTLYGGTGDDTLVGGVGDDTYFVDSAADVVTEDADAGYDTVRSSVSIGALADNVEELVLLDGALDGTGNALNNTLTGNAAGNILDGGAGDDILVGGDGDDIYHVDSLDDSIIEMDNGGTDTVYVPGSLAPSYLTPDYVENVVVVGGGAASLTGNNQDNTLTGGSGADTLSGGGGTDTLVGGTGDDTYVLSAADTADTIVELAGEGSDTVMAAFSYTLGSNLENLTLTGADNLTGTGNTQANTLTGNSGNNTLSGGGGNDTLSGGSGIDSLAGGAGNDTYVIAAGDNVDSITELNADGTDTVVSAISYTLGNNLEQLTLSGTANIDGTGNGLANTITGNSGSNTLTGGAGIDTLIGGAGNDTYVITATGDNNDVITELAGEGTDTVQSAVTWTLGSNLENLTLTGATAINGTGNTLDNTLAGNSANNTLNGGGGSDTLTGGGGTDTLVGGAGDDTYVLASTDGTDVVSESAGQGTDTVQSGLSAYTLGSNVENLTLTGSGNSNGTGNALGNVLVGNSGNNTLNGGAGSDTLKGGTGNDALIGGVGNDTYVLNRGDGNDSITESDTTAGNTDVANFGESGTAIDHDQLWFSQSGNNLVVSVIGTSDQFTINNWFLSSARHVETFTTSDGYTLSDTQVQNLVNAMASFTPPPAGTTELDPGTYQAVIDQMAASWVA